MKILVDIPDEYVPEKQEIMKLDLYFMNKKLCGCTYPAQVVIDEVPTGEWSCSNTIQDNVKEKKVIVRLKIENLSHRMAIVEALSENGYHVWLQTTVRNGVLVCFDAKEGYINNPIKYDIEVDNEEGNDR